MQKYYTNACNFFYGHNSKLLVKKKKSLPVGGNQEVSFDHIEIITRTSKQKIHINKIKFLNKNLRRKIISDIRNITKKKKIKNLNLKKVPLLMGIINLTPDSFSDGGKYNTVKKSYMRAKKLIEEGCDLLDIGGESTRPGSKIIDENKEWNRIAKPLKMISKLNKFISVDTRKKAVMENSYKLKVNLINDISGLEHDKKTLPFLKKTNIPFVIHHIQGTPQNMQKNPKYKNVVLDIYDYFENKLSKVRALGINHNNIILDPGIGFGKNIVHNKSLIKNISIFHSLGYPLLVGVSKKKFIKDICGKNDSKNRYGGTISSSLFLMKRGVQIFRIHDINEIKQAFKVYNFLNY